MSNTVSPSPKPPLARSLRRNVSLGCAFLLLNIWCFAILSSAYMDIADVIVFWCLVIATIPLLLWEERKLLAPILLYIAGFQALSLAVVDADLALWSGIFKLSWFSLPPFVIIFVAHHFIARPRESDPLSQA